MRGVGIGARVPFATVAADHLHEGGNRLSDHSAEETASELDEAIPCHTEFVLEGLSQLSPHCESVGLAMSLSPILRRWVGIKGIHPGFPPFGRWGAARGHDRSTLRAGG